MTRSVIPLPPLQAVERHRLHDIETGARLEWFESDGEGGYAAGTAVNANTRHDHGLVVAPVPDVGARCVLLSRFEETAILEDGTRYDLGVAFYPGAAYPTGHMLLTGFSLDPWPTWRYRFGDAELVKELFLSRRARSTVLRYRARGPVATLELRPLVPARTGPGLTRAYPEIRQDAEASERLVGYQPHDEIPPLVLSFVEGKWQARPDWYYRTVYPREAEQGGEAQEDLFSPGVLVLPVTAGEPVLLACGRWPARVALGPQWIAEELRRRGHVADGGRSAAHGDARLEELGARLGLAGDAFLVAAPEGRAVLPGFPPREPDALIEAAALPGLCIVTGRFADAAAILRSLEERLAGRSTAAAASESTARAIFWFVDTVARLGEHAPVSGLASRALDLLDACTSQPASGIRITDEGLITCTAPDGSVGERSVGTNALWYNALLRAADLTTDAGRAERYTELARRCRQAFDAFWFADGGYLFDRLDADGRGNPECRPDQLLAVSLAHSPLDQRRARKVVDTVDRDLVVTLGVRSSSVRDRSRGAAPATPRLLGHFAVAYSRVYGDDRHTRERLRNMLLAFEAHLDEQVLGHIAQYTSDGRRGGYSADALACAALLELLHVVTAPVAAPRLAVASAAG